MARLCCLLILIATILPLAWVEAEPGAPMAENGEVFAGKPAENHPVGMVWIPGGEFTMGNDDPTVHPNERPAHRVRVDGFWMDIHLVTNKDFAEFVKATGYQTVAERPVNWEELKQQLPPGTEKPPEEMLQPGALVFTPPSHPVSLENMANWWTWTTGASWRHPEGPNSSIVGRENHPVVQVAYEDVLAYCKWAGKRLPTEAEWEYAARGGSSGTRFFWGDDFTPAGRHMANTFQGKFPYLAAPEDGYPGTSPVGSFPANGHGLYDMAGNVWQWTSDWYRFDSHQGSEGMHCMENPSGPAASFDPHEPFTPKRVIKGGSFLCHVDYCESYRPSARRGGALDTGSGHVGFRTVKDAGMD